MDNKARIEALRSSAVRPCIDREVFTYLFYKNFKDNTAKIHEERYGEAFAYAFENLPTPISDGELIVGERTKHLTADESREWNEIYKPFALEHTKTVRGQDSHMAIDYDLVLSKGLLGIIDIIDGHLRSCDEDKKPFYNVC